MNTAVPSVGPEFYLLADAFEEKFRDCVRKERHEELKNLLFGQPDPYRDAWRLMLGINYAWYERWHDAPEDGKQYFAFEKFLPQLDEKGRSKEITEFLSALKSPLVLRHYAKGAKGVWTEGECKGKEDEQGSPPSHPDIWSNFELQRTARSAVDSATVMDDWYLMGNQNFIFFTVAMGDYAAYDDQGIVRSRAWYVDADPSGITDCWMTRDFLDRFKHYRDPQTGEFGMVRTSRLATRVVDDPDYSASCRVPLRIRGTGSEILRAAALELLEKGGKPDMSAVKLMDMLSEAFDDKTEVKVPGPSFTHGAQWTRNPRYYPS